MKGSPRSPRQLRGFSLPEVLLAVSIMSGVLVGVLGILNLGLRRWNTQAGHSLAMQEANIAMERMCKDIRSAISFNTVTVGSNVVNNFVLPANTDAAGNYIPQRSGAALTYNSG